MVSTLLVRSVLLKVLTDPSIQIFFKKWLKTISKMLNMINIQRNSQSPASMSLVAYRYNRSRPKLAKYSHSSLSLGLSANEPMVIYLNFAAYIL